jgi:hypothetical protein
MAAALHMRKMVAALLAFLLFTATVSAGLFLGQDSVDLDGGELLNVAGIDFTGGGLAFGANSSANGTDAAAYGPETEASGDNAAALGVSASGTGGDGVALGSHAAASAPNASALTGFATASAARSLGLGTGTVASGADSIAVGRDADASTGSGIAVGRSSTVSGSSSIALGRDANASADNSVAIGKDAVADEKNMVELGSGGTSYGLRVTGSAVFQSGVTLEADTTTQGKATFQDLLQLESRSRPTCNSDRNGVIVRDSSDNELYYCDNNDGAWEQLSN